MVVELKPRITGMMYNGTNEEEIRRFILDQCPQYDNLMYSNRASRAYFTATTTGMEVAGPFIVSSWDWVIVERGELSVLNNLQRHIYFDEVLTSGSENE